MGLFARWTGAFPTRVWTDKKSTTSASSPTHTFTGVAIGTASPTRDVFVATGSTIVSAVTIGGVSATLVASVTGLYLWRATVPTGTTASIAVTWTGTSRILIEVWAAYNISDTTPFDTASYTPGGSSTTHSTTIDKPTGGILIAATDAIVTPGQTLSSWSGATVDDNTVVGAGAVDLVISGASSENTTAATGATLQTTWSGSVSARIVAATFL